MKNEWIEWFTDNMAMPSLPVGARVRVKWADDFVDTGEPHDPNCVDWAQVAKYLVVPETNEARLERELAAAVTERDHLRARVAEMENLCANTGRERNEARTERDELRQLHAGVSAGLSTAMHNYFDHIESMHRAIKQGIAAGDLPADFYARMCINWAPKK